jgi:RND family efflux transporter MFP subunit
MEARQFFVEEWTELVGTTQPLPNRAARITALVEGRVTAVLQDAAGKPLAEGAEVKKGEPIVQLDATVARANRDKAQAAYQEAKQQVKQAEAAVRLAEVEVRRVNGLHKKMLAADVELEKAQIALDESKAKQQGAELHQVSVEKELAALEEQLKLFTLTAPISGRLGRILVVPGQTLAPGTLVAEVADLDSEIDVLCFVPPAVARKLKKSQPARVETSAEPAKDRKANDVEGKVEFHAEQAEMDTGNFAVKVRFPNNRLHLRGGITLRIRVLTEPGRAALTLPESAILEDQDPPAVLVVENYKKEIKKEEGKEDKEVEMGTVRKLRAKLGVRDRVLHLVEILGLDDPEKKWQGTLDTAQFVVERGQGLRNGDAIRLEVEEEEETPEKKD